MPNSVSIAPTLPSFRIAWNGGELNYTPACGRIEDRISGEVTNINIENAERLRISAGISSPLLREQFRPVCLTVFSGHRCNLACPYCYVSNKTSLPQTRVAPELLQQAAAVVATNCVERGQPFVLGFHGGNEPLLHPHYIRHCIEVCKREADQSGLELHSFCTTNGVIPTSTAMWAARTFHGVTLSWDGPPDIQDCNRMQCDGSPTSSIVRRTAAIFSGAIAQFKVRTTVTRESVIRLLDIVQYFHRQKVRHVECYPVFQNSKRTVPPRLLPPASEFVKNFLIARKWARGNGMTLGYAGSRIHQFHDRFCPVYQRNLTITADGYLTACFQVSHNGDPDNTHYMYGCLYAGRETPPIDWPKLEAIFSKLARPYPECVRCFNQLHCSKMCPTACPIAADHGTNNSLDCTIERWIGLANILDQANYVIGDEVLEDCSNFFSRVAVEPIEA